MRVLALLHEAFGGEGGIAQFNRDFLSAAAAGPTVEQVVVLLRHLPAPPGPLPDRIELHRLAAAGKIPYALAVVKAALLGGGIDLVVCGHLRLLPLGRLAARLARAPLLLLAYGIDVWEPPAGSRGLGGVDAVLAISEFTKGKLLRWAPAARIHVVPSAVDPARFGAGPRNPALVERYRLAGKTVLLTLARLAASERYKGIDEVLDCLPALAARRPGLVYLVAGDGDDRPRLEAKAQGLGLADRVIFCGRVAEAEKADHYRLADAFVMAGRGEGFGIVFLEAMACGVPVVGSALDGSRDALRDGRLGLLVDPGDRAALADAIATALAMPKGVPDGLDYFHFTRFAERVQTLLDSVRATPDESPGRRPSTRGRQP
jgi:phosphatidylinositol alpha-1,6-mannosyltransferase